MSNEYIRRRLIEKLAEEDMDAYDEGVEDAPRVVCNCLCVDCAYNEDELCTKDEIELEYSDSDDGRVICECVSYEPTDGNILAHNSGNDLEGEGEEDSDGLV